MARHKSFIFFLLSVTIFKVVFTGWFNLSADEAYYWIWSENLDFGYFDHPPMVAYFIAATKLLGDSERIIRLAAVLSGAVVTSIVYAIASDMFVSRRTGLAAAILVNVIPVFAIGGMIITPDTPLTLFWALALYFGYKIVETQRPHYWYAMGFSFGLSLISKYNAALFAPAFLAFLLFSTENRRWLFRKEPYLAFALSMIIFAPVLYWNSTHDWISFHFQLSHAFASEAPKRLWLFSQFWLGQVGLYGGPLFFFILASSFGIGWMALREERDDYLYLAFMSAGLFIFFLFNSFRSWMEGNWSVMAYIAAAIATPGFVSYVSERMSEKSGKALSSTYVVTLAISAAMVLYVHAYITFPSVPMPDRGEINRRVYGYDGLGVDVGKKLEEMNEKTFIATSRYQIASLLRYYTPDHRDAYMTTDIGRFRYSGSDDELVGRDALYVTERKRLELERVKKYFDRVEAAGDYDIVRDGETVRRFVYYKCYNYRGGLIQF